MNVKSKIDSGCAISVSPACICPHVAAQPSAGSKAGQQFVVASGDPVANQGEKHLMGVTDEGCPTKKSYQLADITCPLDSVGDICDSGPKRVVFGRAGGYILNLETGESTFFPRVGKLYELTTWFHKDSNPFGRPGTS